MTPEVPVAFELDGDAASDAFFDASATIPFPLSLPFRCDNEK